jgi:hypothetical protein
MPNTLRKKLYAILHRSFVESRNLALARNCQQLYDLADTFEVVPPLLENGDDKQLETLRGILAAYQAKYPQTASDYLAILNMPDAEFETVFGSRHAF